MKKGPSTMIGGKYLNNKEKSEMTKRFLNRNVTREIYFTPRLGSAMMDLKTNKLPSLFEFQDSSYFS